LIALEKEGIVAEQRFGRVRMITLQLEYQNTELLLEALRVFDKKDLRENKLAANGGEVKQLNKGPETGSAEVDAESPFSRQTPGPETAKGKSHEKQRKNR
jgi:hypothetical protein